MLKQKKFRSKKYLMWVSERPCLLCMSEPCQAHHITIAELRGMGQRVSDNFTIPLCYQHHHQLHMTGERSFWQKLGINPKHYSELLFATYNSNKLECDVYLWENMYKKVTPYIKANIDFLTQLK
jgi:hypothetical protein|tara:strand:- start:2956 stop:3327 length:372 start_codon:yes stop_codon:yes gene_type:complete